MTKSIEELIYEITPLIGENTSTELWEAGRSWGHSQYELGRRNTQSERDWGNLDAAEKLRIVKAMGFSRTSEDHQRDCMSQIDSGLVCNCVPDVDTFSPPQDVVSHLGQTWEERLQRARARNDED